MIEDVICGTEKKLAIHIEPTPAFDISNTQHKFEIELFCTGSIIFKVPEKDIKASADDKHTRIVTFNTKDVGCGRLKCRVIAHIPDGDFSPEGSEHLGIRTEIYDFITKLNIVKGLK